MCIYTVHARNTAARMAPPLHLHWLARVSRRRAGTCITDDHVVTVRTAGKTYARAVYVVASCAAYLFYYFRDTAFGSGRRRPDNVKLNWVEHRATVFAFSNFANWNHGAAVVCEKMGDKQA